MKDNFEYFPEWDYNLYASNKAYKFLKDDYMIVINMYYRIMDNSIPRYESIYERRKKEFKNASMWQKNKKFTDAVSALNKVRSSYEKLRHYQGQIKYLIEQKESLEKRINNE